MGLIRLIVLGFIGLSVVYLAISIFSRSVRRERLEKEWDANPPAGGDMATRDTYIQDGMADYESGFRKKLIVLVYVIPTIAVTVILFITNTD